MSSELYGYLYQYNIHFSVLEYFIKIGSLVLKWYAIKAVIAFVYHA